MVGKYPVITICGSTRFKEMFLHVLKQLTLEGNIVLLPGVYTHAGDAEAWEPGRKEVLVDMHRRKIDMSDAIFVVNVGGYVGESTRAEIEYARKHGREVRWLEPPD